jgi:2-polyprenyl-3-methyl-5-hydroxy-6-metoxy-1,4-benzoquinol methylase
MTSVCQVCTRSTLKVVAGFGALPRVTSDCKPWPAGGTIAVCDHCGAAQKLSDDRWLDEIKEIYRQYQIHSFFGGVEQVIFDAAGGAAPRSRTLIDFMLAHAGHSKQGALIDIGSGNGAALANFSAALPSWSLYGCDLSDAALGALRRLPNFHELYIVPMSQIGRQFDLISMMHSLAQMPDPYGALRDARPMLADGGMLFVETANIETSPFDLLVADELVHLSPTHLAHLVERAGFSVSAIRDDVLPKEITLLAGRGSPEPRSPCVPGNAARIRAFIDWFERILEQARTLARQGGELGIFGTSISASWLDGAMGSAVSFFVDEDRSRIGQNVGGRPIFSTAEAPAGASVLMPLAPHIADGIISRIAHSKTTFVPPPPLVA